MRTDSQNRTESVSDAGRPRRRTLLTLTQATLVLAVLLTVIGGCAILRERPLPAVDDGLGDGPDVGGGLDGRTPVPLPRLHTDDGDGFVVIAHRGASGYAPENTMSAFRLAREMRAEMIELDIMLTADGVPVAFHDDDLAKTTDEEGAISLRTLAELRELEAGAWFAEEFDGEPIPTLDEVLEWASGRMSLNIEIKTEAWRASLEQSVEPRVVDAVRRHGMERHVLFSSFDYRVVARLKELAPEIPTAVLYEKTQSAGRDPVRTVRDLGADAFNCSWRELTPEWLAGLKSAGIPVFVYTVNDPRRMRRLIEQGVAGIFSDYPDELSQAAAASR